MAESRSKLDSYLPAFLRRLVAVAGVARYVPAGASAASQMARRWLQDAGLEVDTSSKASAHELTTVMIWFVDT